MTNNTKMGALIICIAILFLTGCFPENSLKWSTDGSVGILQKEESIYLVDGKTAELTKVATNGSLMPDISQDGKWIAYCQKFQCDKSCKTIDLLPKNQANKIKNHAKWLKKQIIEKGMIIENDIPKIKRTRRGQAYGTNNAPALEYTEEYAAWVMRYMCENADNELKEKLTANTIEKAKKLTLTYYKLIVAKSNNLQDKKILATAFAPLFRPMFSPDSKHLAYLMQMPEINTEKEQGDTDYRLYVASPDQKIISMHIDSGVAYGYDWRPDSKALAYIRGELVAGNGISPGELKEVEIADANSTLLAEKIDRPEGTYASHYNTGRTKGQVGIHFYPWSKLQYGPNGRIFFVSLALTIPSVEYENAGLKLFCYDTLTNTISDVLPSALTEYTKNSMPACHFSLSPDGKKVLIPIQKNKFIIYKLATNADDVITPIAEDEGFGDDQSLQLTPAWKGNDKISCLIAEDSHLLNDPNAQRKEIVILNDKGKFLKNLSKDWPKDILND